MASHALKKSCCKNEASGQQALWKEILKQSLHWIRAVRTKTDQDVSDGRRDERDRHGNRDGMRHARLVDAKQEQSKHNRQKGQAADARAALLQGQLLRDLAMVLQIL